MAHENATLPAADESRLDKGVVPCPTCGSDCNERDELGKAEREIARLMGVVVAVNSRCDHLGMRLGEVILERDKLRRREPPNVELTGKPGTPGLSGSALS